MKPVYASSVLYLSCLILALSCIFDGSHAQAAGNQPNGPQSTAFIGAWCAQGDPSKQASISDNGAFLNLTNENGDTSIGNYQGQRSIVAPGWQFVTGTLSNDGGQINWSNGTFWSRCNTNGGGGWHGRINLGGTWYAQGDRSRSCTIQQHGKSLQLTNEQGNTAIGTIQSGQRLNTNWNGTIIVGALADHANRINWNNGTYWIRYRVWDAPHN